MFLHSGAKDKEPQKSTILQRLLNSFNTAVHNHWELFMCQFVRCKYKSKRKIFTSTQLSSERSCKKPTLKYKYLPKSSGTRVLTFLNVIVDCFCGFHKHNKEGLSRNDDCYKNTHRDVPGGLNNIGGLTCFQNMLHWMASFQNRRWGQPLAKSAESIEELFLSKRFISTNYAMQSCCLDK